MPRYCGGCSITHLVKDCLDRPKDDNNFGEKTMLNMVGVIPSRQISQTKNEMENVPLTVVTRAQARQAHRGDKSGRSPR